MTDIRDLVSCEFDIVCVYILSVEQGRFGDLNSDSCFSDVAIKMLSFSWRLKNCKGDSEVIFWDFDECPLLFPLLRA